MTDVWTPGWDASHYDEPPTQRDGIQFYTHKCAEGHHFYRDTEYGQAMANARGLGIPILGPYYVNHPGTVVDQVDWFLALVDQYTPWWRDWRASGGCWTWQIDAEKFNYMDRAPTRDEINAFGDLVCSRTQMPADSVLAYAPKWLYGDSLRGLRYRLWASNYGSNPAVHYPDAYPGNDSPRWVAYSGQKPIILQYGSRLTIGNQTTCDGNGFPGTVTELAETLGGEDMALTLDDVKLIVKGVWDEDITTRTNQRSAGSALWFARQNALAANTRLVAMAPQLDEILVAAQDDGDTNVVLDPASLAFFQEMKAAIDELPTAEEQAAIVDKQLDQQSMGGADAD